jgi:sec-independent protein translocase protein TatA
MQLRYSTHMQYTPGAHALHAFDRTVFCSTFVIRLNHKAMNATLLFLSGVGFQEILLIGLFVLVFFGAKKIPEFMKGLGVEDAGSASKIEEGK